MLKISNQPLSAGYCLFCNCPEADVKESDGITAGAMQADHTQNKLSHRPLN